MKTLYERISPYLAKKDQEDSGERLLTNLQCIHDQRPIDLWKTDLQNTCKTAQPHMEGRT